MTALDVCYLLYSPRSIGYVRKILTDLAGGGDKVSNAYLYRFSLPSVFLGNPKRVYTLGSRGRTFLVREAGMKVDWCFRPDKVMGLSFGKIVHDLSLTRFLVAAKRWSETEGGCDLLKVRTCYELGSGTDTGEDVDAEKKEESVAVVPDGWLLFERRKDKWRVPVFLEIDRGTEFRERFKRHIAARIEYVKKGGEYARVFGTEAVVIAYATTGERAQYREARRRSMCEWTMEVLKERRMASWAQVFRFHSLTLEEIYEMTVFKDRVWFRPDQERPVGLL